ncbi:MAG: hypothetical protein AAFW98_03050 [Pseudomonadota bacterium]
MTRHVVSSGFWRGLAFAAPLSLALWAVLVWFFIFLWSTLAWIAWSLS